MENKPNRIIWHHTADTTLTPQADKVNLYHRKIHFPISRRGFYGGYHYLIERDGTTFQYRDENEIGAHDKDENVNSIGVCLAGNFDVEIPTDAQAATLAALLKRLMSQYAIPPSRVEPHRLGDATHCPGMRLADSWAVALLPRTANDWLIKQLRDILLKLEQ